MPLGGARIGHCYDSKPYGPAWHSPFLHRRLGGLSPTLGSPSPCGRQRRAQQLKRKHLTLRTRIKRLVRRTLCFSKSTAMHELVIGLFINRFEFGLEVSIEDIN